ncbi:MAG: PQQ-dependent sugar dehydrogenase [Planctomycetes bacterium]|nr:PQQ-dependent sugar dehydrogenase [Planctomycetota bacterium]MCW8134251.1 PQQ-dependent sugar dehydrogenase [Planctomycetota bacterium]
MRWILALCLCGALGAQTFAVPDFSVETVATPGYGTIALDFDHAGRMYVTEKRGRILQLTPNGSGGFNAPTVFADLISFVEDTFECGLLGLALDPDYATNRYIYLCYTTPTDQRVMRIQANATFDAWTTTQTSILTGLPRAAGNHNAGDIGFRPGEPNNLYVMLGDDANIGQADNLDQYHGKLLRINKSNGEGLTTNPFYTSSTATVRSRIWAYGFRNPFRFAFHPTLSNALYTSENGGPGGVSLQDRLTFNRAGCNGGWNTSSSTGGSSGEFYNPVNPAGQECIVMHRDQSSHIGVAVANGGVFGDPANPGASVIYISNWLRPNSSGSISRFRLTGTNLDTATPIAADGGARWVTGVYGISLKFGPDGHLYFTQATNGTSAGTGYIIGRIRYTGTVTLNAAFHATPSSGTAPLNVQFTDTSTGAASWSWDFGDGGTSTQQNPQHVFAAGNWMVTLTVTDGGTGQDTAQTTINVATGTGGGGGGSGGSKEKGSGGGCSLVSAGALPLLLLAFAATNWRRRK